MYIKKTKLICIVNSEFNICIYTYIFYHNMFMKVLIRISNNIYI